MQRHIFGSKPAKKHLGQSPGRIVVAKVHHSAAPYVTWFHNMQLGGYSSGHYFVTAKDAIRDFNERS